MNDTRHSNQTTAILRLIDILVPRDDGQLLERNTPVEPGSLLVEFLLQLLNATFLNLIGLELLEIIGETELFPDPNRPLGRIILVPLDGVAIV